MHLSKLFEWGTMATTINRWNGKRGGLMKITYEKPTLLNVDDLFRFMKKFYKDYECGGKVVKKRN